MTDSTRLLVEQLQQPDSYPHRPQQVELRETHISWVFLAGDLVYKLKKPVRFDFLDFSTLPLREQACRDEVRLNRRLAPDCYLGVVPVSMLAGRARLRDASAVCDWLVEMRRIPIERGLDRLLVQQSVTHSDIDRLASTLVAFYGVLEPAELTDDAYLERTERHVQENRRELLAEQHGLSGEQVERVHAAQLQLLHLIEPAFRARVAAGHIVEGHGDLRPEHICLSDPITIFDCIEFSREFRTLDKLDELAFLAVECDHLDAAWVGESLLTRFRELTGEAAPEKLWHFYKAYRACVRGKVAALRAEQLSQGARHAALDEARKYLDQADRELAGYTRPIFLVVGGLSGSGKSTLAHQLSELLGARLLRTDIVRQEMLSSAGEAGESVPGKYDPASRSMVYEEMLRQSESLIKRGVPIILDGTFQAGKHLTAAHLQAQSLGATFLAIECHCPPAIALERIRHRQQQGEDASEADANVYLQQREQWEPWPITIPACSVDTTREMRQQVATVMSALRARGN